MLKPSGFSIPFNSLLWEKAKVIVKEKSAATATSSGAFDQHLYLRLRRPLALPGTPWLLGRGQRFVAWFDRYPTWVRNLTAARAALDILTRLRGCLPWSLTWCHYLHLLS